MPDVRVAESDQDILDCHRVVVQLRPHHADAGAFLAQVRRQQARCGFTLACVREAGEVVAVAGFRIDEMLSRGLYMYVDDLVTDERHRSRGYGDALMDWLVARARSAGCTMLVLDSGVHRAAAHRFYFRRRMEIRAYNFGLKL